MRLYITGSVGSGKSTLSRKLSAAWAIPCFELDSVVHRKDERSSAGNVKRPPEEWDALFSDILRQ